MASPMKAVSQGLYKLNKKKNVIEVGELIVTETSTESTQVTELPIGVWTEDYKKHLLNLVESEEVKRFSENHTSSSVHFTVELSSVSH